MAPTKILVCITLCSALAACGSDESSGPARDGDASSDTSTADTSTADTADGGDNDSALPDTTEPDTTEPDTTEPDTTEPDTTEPDATEPDATEPDATEPDATEPDTTEPAGACDNEADLAVLAGATDLAGTIGQCALSCFSGGATCAADCVQTDVGTSAACSACFGEVIQCTFDNCALQCISPESAGCTACRDANCTPAFEDCAGIVQP